MAVEHMEYVAVEYRDDLLGYVFYRWFKVNTDGRMYEPVKKKCPVLGDCVGYINEGDFDRYAPLWYWTPKEVSGLDSGPRTGRFFFTERSE